MANRNRNRNRNRPGNASSQPREGGPQTPRRCLDLPAPISLTDTAHMRLFPGADPAPPPPAGDGEIGETGTRRESRANSVKRGLRSKLLFPLEMKEAIDELAAAFSLQMKPCTSLEKWMVQEMARSSVQCDECSDQLLIDKVRIIERVGISWDDDCAERSEKLSLKLPVAPYNVQRALARTKHGALYLINQLTLLGEAVETNGGLDDPQRQVLYDLLGIEHVYRNGCRQVHRVWPRRPSGRS